MAFYGVACPTIGVIKSEAAGASPVYEDDKGVILGKAIQVSTTYNSAEASLYGDNILAERVTEFQSVTISLNTTTLPVECLEPLFGATVTTATGSSEVVSKAGDTSKFVGFGFVYKEMVSDATKYYMVWFPKVKFKEPNETFDTKGESVSFGTPTIEGVGTADNANVWRIRKPFDTEEAAIAALKEKAKVEAES